MNLSVGIVGLPNVGKSTLFNALLKTQAAHAANYPFATIEPNIGVVPVPDARLAQLAEVEKLEHKMSQTPPEVETTVTFVDIAGLIQGASEGAGLGNKFLSHIREADVICQVVRCFSDAQIIREGSTDPETDYKTIEMELMLADLQTIEKSKVKSQMLKVQLKSQNEVIEQLENALNQGTPIRSLTFSEEEQEFVKSLHLLTAKAEIIALNVAEEEYNTDSIQKVMEKYSGYLFPVTASVARQSSQEIVTSPSAPRNDNIVVICAKIEEELAGLSDDEQKEYLASLGLKGSGLERLIQKAYEELGLISFLTAGAKEVRAWPIKRGTNAQNAAGVIHTDFIKNFIKAEVVSFDDFVECGGWKNSREKGKARLEGKDYIINEGDVVEFKIGK